MIRTYAQNIIYWIAERVGEEICGELKDAKLGNLMTVALRIQESKHTRKKKIK